MYATYILVKRNNKPTKKSIKRFQINLNAIKEITEQPTQGEFSMQNVYKGGCWGSTSVHRRRRNQSGKMGKSHYKAGPVTASAHPMRNGMTLQGCPEWG